MVVPWWILVLVAGWMTSLWMARWGARRGPLQQLWSLLGAGCAVGLAWSLCARGVVAGPGETEAAVQGWRHWVALGCGSFVLVAGTWSLLAPDRGERRLAALAGILVTAGLLAVWGAYAAAVIVGATAVVVLLQLRRQVRLAAGQGSDRGDRVPTIAGGAGNAEGYQQRPAATDYIAFGAIGLLVVVLLGLERFAVQTERLQTIPSRRFTAFPHAESLREATLPAVAPAPTAVGGGSWTEAAWGRSDLWSLGACLVAVTFLQTRRVSSRRGPAAGGTAG